MTYHLVGTVKSNLGVEFDLFYVNNIKNESYLLTKFFFNET